MSCPASKVADGEFMTPLINEGEHRSLLRLRGNGPRQHVSAELSGGCSTLPASSLRDSALDARNEQSNLICHLGLEIGLGLVDTRSRHRPITRTLKLESHQARPSVQLIAGSN